jgi:hypothetical protein
VSAPAADCRRASPGKFRRLIIDVIDGEADHGYVEFDTLAEAIANSPDLSPGEAIVDDRGVQVYPPTGDA